MSIESAIVNARKTPNDELNVLFDALAHPCRRAIVDELEEGVPTALEELVERVDGTDNFQSVSDAEIVLVHCHLPRLDDAGVVDYDPDERLCTLNDARVVRSVLDAARDED